MKNNSGQSKKPGYTIHHQSIEFEYFQEFGTHWTSRTFTNISIQEYFRCFLFPSTYQIMSLETVDIIILLSFLFSVILFGQVLCLIFEWLIHFEEEN